MLHPTLLSPENRLHKESSNSLPVEMNGSCRHLDSLQTDKDFNILKTETVQTKSNVRDF